MIQIRAVVIESQRLDGGSDLEFDQELRARHVVMGRYVVEIMHRKIQIAEILEQDDIEVLIS